MWFSGKDVDLGISYLDVSLILALPFISYLTTKSGEDCCED